MSFTANDKALLRDLASQYIAIAMLPIHQEKIQLWKALNRGEMQRPMVVIDQLPWNELNLTGELTCHIEDPFWRSIERSLRETLYKWTHFPVDMVIEPFINIPKAIHSTGLGINAQTEMTSENGDVYAQHFTAVIHDLDEVDLIKDPIITHDTGLSTLWMQEASEIFQGIAPIRQFNDGYGCHLGVWDTLTQLLGGVGEIYMDLIDRPDFIHAAMERITQAKIAEITQMNALDLFNPQLNTCHCSYTYTDELLPGIGKGSSLAHSKNCWAFGLAQLFTCVSPEFMAEFEIPYAQRMADHFGMIYYGCCDRLDDRLDLVKSIPNVKKVSCSPWSNRENFAQHIGPTLTMSNKPTPAFLAENSLNPAAIAADLQLTYDLAKANHVNLEFILKDVSTVRYDPSRLTQWAETAMQVVTA